MKKYLVIAVILLTTFATEANENSFVQSNSRGQYQQCVAVSLYTIQGKELNSTVENNRTIKDTNAIPEGWTVVGVTTKKELLLQISRRFSPCPDKKYTSCKALNKQVTHASDDQA